MNGMKTVVVILMKIKVILQEYSMVRRIRSKIVLNFL